MLTCSVESADSALPLKAAACAPLSLSSETGPASATSATTGPACPSSPMSTTWTPSSAQLWPTASANKTTKNRKAPAKMKEDGCQTALADAIHLHTQGVELWPTPMVNDATGSQYCYDHNREKLLKLPGAGAQHHSSSPPASRVSRPVPPASAREAAMTAGSGRRLSAWLPGSSPAGACLKTLLASPAWRSPLRSLTWTLKGYAGCPDEPSLKSSGDLTFWDMTSPATGMASLGFRVCRLSVSELSTDATGSGSSPGGEMWGTPRADEWKGCGPTGGKAHLHRLERDYLDAQAQSHAELWASPMASDFKNKSCDQWTKNLSNEAVEFAACQTGPEPSLNAEPTASRGQLNPDFVCWLMGYPAGWLNYADSATPSSPKSRRKSSPPSVTPNA